MRGTWLSAGRAARAQPRHSKMPTLLPWLVLLALAQVSRTAITDHPSLSDRLYQLYERLEKLSIHKPAETKKVAFKPSKFVLNSLKPKLEVISDDDEELLSTMQMWGAMSPDQLAGMAREIQELREDEPEYSEDDGWDDMQDMMDGEDYAMDAEDMAMDDTDDEESTTARPQLVTPSAIIRPDPVLSPFRMPAFGDIDPIAATNERPKILDDSSITAAERKALSRAAVANMAAVVRAGQCSRPQARWLSVRQLAPAANTVYMPPCVQLHRCAPDTGCCYSEDEVCAPIEGQYIALPFYLNRADSSMQAARMLFYNHTRCGCVSRKTMQWTGDRGGVRDWREVREGRATANEELLEKDEATAPPQMVRRCTCPTLFLAKITDGNCSCVCDFPDSGRRRDCLSFSKGQEHFGMRDRHCLSRGDCNVPTCAYGPFDEKDGKCPARRYRRTRYRYSRRPNKNTLA